MPFYENVFIARQDISSQQVDDMIENFTNLISENGGTVNKTEYWGVRGLAYRVKKNRKGHYVLMNIDGLPDSVLELERQMRLNEDIIRYMTVKVEELDEGPSVMMQSRNRGGRGERSERTSRDGENAEPGDGNVVQQQIAVADDGED